RRIRDDPDRQRPPRRRSRASDPGGPRGEPHPALRPPHRGSMEREPGCDPRRSGWSSACSPPAVMEPKFPRLGHYRVTEWLGAGAMASVYRAQHLEIGREVALKVMSRRYLGDETSKLRFLNEARAANRVRHPNVVEITDIGFD